jgi:ammonia channel protein AmtB
MAVLAVLPLRKVSVVAVVSVAILIAGLLFPIAAKLIWFGPLRRVGLIDLAGATVVLSTCGALSITLLRLTTNAVKVSVIDSPIAASAGAILTIAGWVGLLFSASVMQSPATPMPALLNVLRAITAAALVAAVVAKLFRKDEGPLRIIAAINLAAAMTTALAGRAPAGAAVVLGFIAGLVAPTITAAARGLLHRGPAGDFAAVTWAGGFIACLLAVPYSRDPDALHIQLVVQLAGFAACSGAGICAGILIAPFVKLLSPRQLNQPIAAS